MDDLVIIDRPIQDVFEFVSNQANGKLWKPFVTESRQVSAGQIGVGTQFVEGIDIWNRHLAGIVEIIEYEPYHWYVYKTREEPYPFSFTAQLSFESTESGTAIRGHVEFLGHGSWKWLIPLIRLFFKSQEKQTFHHLKKVIENSSHRQA